MIRLAIRCRSEQAGAVLAELAVLAPNGVEERSLGDAVEYSIYGAEGELPDLGGIDAAVGGALVDVESSVVADDWETRWRQFHSPVTIGGRLHIRPPWSEAAASGEIDIVIDPGQAFGTGAHATTRLCLELLLESGEDAGPVTDLGTGSGVLAIAAAKLGFDPIAAFDHERASVEATQANAAANGVAVEASHWDIRRSLPPLARVTVANLLSPLLIEMAGRLGEMAECLGAEGAPEVLICSGILSDQADDVVNAFAEAGYVESSRKGAGEWIALDMRFGSRL